MNMLVAQFLCEGPCRSVGAALFGSVPECGAGTQHVDRYRFFAPEIIFEAF